MSLKQNILNEPVSTLNLRPLPTAQPDVTVRESLEVMRSAALGCVIFLDDDDRPMGMFNEKLLIRLLYAKPDEIDQPVRPHITRNVWCIRASDRIAQFVAMMQAHKLRWACVVDDDGKAIGITGLKGLVEYVVENFPRLCLVEPMRSNIAMETREGA